MGFFSWKTQDTGKSIANSFSDRETFKVVMTDNKNNQWIEENYEGYGVFGGKDFYQLLAEMNNLPITGDVEHDRLLGIDLAFSEEPFISPNLSETDNWKWENRHPLECEEQGYFYSY